MHCVSIPTKLSQCTIYHSVTMEVSNLNNSNEIDVHGTVHSKSDDGEADMMDEDQSLCELLLQI